MKNVKRSWLYVVLGVVLVAFVGFALMKVGIVKQESSAVNLPPVVYDTVYIQGKVIHCPDTFLIVMSRDIKPKHYVRQLDGSLQRKFTTKYDTVQIRNGSFSFRKRYITEIGIVHFYLANEGWPKRLVQLDPHSFGAALILNHVERYFLTIDGLKLDCKVDKAIRSADGGAARVEPRSNQPKLRIPDLRIIKLHYAGNRFLLEKIYDGKEQYDPDTLQQILDCFDPSLRKSVMGRKLKAYVEARKSKSL